MSLEVHTLHYGSHEWMPECAGSLDAWCERHSLPLRVWGDEFPAYPCAKFGTLEMLRTFLAGTSERFLFVDADVFVHPQAPIFPFADGLCIAVDLDPNPPFWTYWLEHLRPDLGGRVRENAGCQWLYLNTGVWMADRDAAAAILAMAVPPFILGIQEQNQFNLWIMRAFDGGMTLHHLDQVWNSIRCDVPAWFFHLAGYDKPAKLASARAASVLPSSSLASCVFKSCVSIL